MNRYKRGKKLGNGLSGNAYAAVDTVTGEKVCLKVYSRSKDGQSEGRNEIEALLNLANCERVIDMLDYFWDGKRCHVVLPLMGDDLFELLAEWEEGLPPEWVSEISKQLFEGLAAIHAAGYIHCDLKPENLMLTKSVKRIKSVADIELRIIDFASCVKISEYDLSELVQTHIYRPPERILDLPISTRFDIWSAGCLVYELLTGVELFDDGKGDSDDDSEDDCSCDEDDCEDFEELIHLQQMYMLIGPVPNSMIMGSDRRKLFFHRGDNHLRGSSQIEPGNGAKDLYRSMRDCDIARRVAREWSNKLIRMLCWESGDRLSAMQCVELFK